MDFDYDEDMGVCLNNGVWNVRNGTVLKLDEGRRITHAVRGFTPLTRDKIREIYGEPSVYIHLKWPKTNRYLENEETEHWAFMGHFDSFKLAEVSQVTDLMDRGVIKGKTLMQLAFDLA